MALFSNCLLCNAARVCKKTSNRRMLTQEPAPDPGDQTAGRQAHWTFLRGPDLAMVECGAAFRLW